MTTTKPAYNTVKIQLDDGTYVHVKRCATSDLEAFLELLEELVKEYIICEGALSSILVQPKMVANLEAICGLLPLVGKGDETKYLEYDSIKDNWEQLAQLFFNRDLDVKTREFKSLEPGSIAALHFFPHIKVVQAALKELKAQRKEEEKDAENSVN